MRHISEFCLITNRDLFCGARSVVITDMLLLISSVSFTFPGIRFYPSDVCDAAGFQKFQEGVGRRWKQAKVDLEAGKNLN